MGAAGGDAAEQRVRAYDNRKAYGPGQWPRPLILRRLRAKTYRRQKWEKMLLTESSQERNITGVVPGAVAGYLFKVPISRRMPDPT